MSGNTNTMHGCKSAPTSHMAWWLRSKLPSSVYFMWWVGGKLSSNQYFSNTLMQRLCWYYSPVTIMYENLRLKRGNTWEPSVELSVAHIHDGSESSSGLGGLNSFTSFMKCLFNIIVHCFWSLIPTYFQKTY